MYSSFAAHSITDRNDHSLDAASYSRFKFGDGDIARQYGFELADAFIEHDGDALLAAAEIVLVPSPYDAIPTASYAMAQAFRLRMNRWLYSEGKQSLLESKIHRYKTYTADYGAMSAEERLQLISGDTYHLDRHFLEGRTVLFMDDIRITGSHQKIIERQLEKDGVTCNAVFLYYAILSNGGIAPEFENHLNYFDVKDISGITALFNAPQFVMNTRVIKYILKGSKEDLRHFLQHADKRRLQQLADYAIGNNYHLISDYNSNLHTLIQTLTPSWQSTFRKASANR